MYLLALLLSATPIDQAWLDARTPPYVLNDETVYELQTDISTPGAAIKIKALGVVLDLNGHTITYDQLGGGVPDHSFEVGGAWEMSPTIERLPLTERPKHGEFYLSIPTRDEPQTIVSGWTDLPNGLSQVSMIVSPPAHVARHWIRVEIEHETDGVVAGSQSLVLSMFNFNANAGKHRIRLTIVPEPKPEWRANSSYRLGDVVGATSGDIRRFVLNRVNGVSKGESGTIEPDWSTELGGLTEDGNVTWITREIGKATPSGTRWQPGKAYQPIYSYVVPTTPNGCVYEPYRITVDGAQSGSSEPNWQTGNQATTDGPLSWGISRDYPLELDMVDVRPRGIRGVEFQWWGSNEKPVTIRNGTIRQGAGGSYQGHALYVGGANGALIEDLTLETNGLEAAGIQAQWGDNYTVRGNTITTTSAHKFNRHQLAAPLMMANIRGGLITDNTVMSGEGWGCIYVSNKAGEAPSLVANNVCSTRSVITNHYAILAYGFGHIVRGNTIDCDPGQGLRLSKKGNLAENNTITVHSVSPNWDVGRLSLDAVRINDYNTSNAATQGSDNVVRNNTITLYGRNSSKYRRAQQILNGICNVSRGSGNVYEGNTVNAIKVDPEIVVSGLMPGNTGGLIVWRSNAITSDQYHLLFGHYSGTCANALFESNTFSQGENPDPSYAIMHSHRRSFDIQATRFEQNSIIGPGDFREVYGGVTWAKPSSYTVGSSSQITIDLTGSGYTLNDLQIKDKSGEIVHEGGNTATLGDGYSVEFRRASPYWFYSGGSDSGAPYSLSGTIEATP